MKSFFYLAIIYSALGFFSAPCFADPPAKSQNPQWTSDDIGSLSIDAVRNMPPKELWDRVVRSRRRGTFFTPQQLQELSRGQLNFLLQKLDEWNNRPNNNPISWGLALDLLSRGLSSQKIDLVDGKSFDIIVKHGNFLNFSDKQLNELTLLQVTRVQPGNWRLLSPAKVRTIFSRFSSKDRELLLRSIKQYLSPEQLKAANGELPTAPIAQTAESCSRPNPIEQLLPKEVKEIEQITSPVFSDSIYETLKTHDKIGLLVDKSVEGKPADVQAKNYNPELTQLLNDENLQKNVKSLAFTTFGANPALKNLSNFSQLTSLKIRSGYLAEDRAKHNDDYVASHFAEPSLAGPLINLIQNNKNLKSVDLHGASITYTDVRKIVEALKDGGQLSLLHLPSQLQKDSTSLAYLATLKEKRPDLQVVLGP